MAKFEAFCNPQKNVTWECHLFNTRNQQLGETINQYVTDLKTKAKSCEFGTLSGSLIRYLIIISRKTHDQISKRPLLKSKTELVTFSGHKLKACGKTSVVYEYKQKLNVVEFEVQQNVSSVLGLKTCEEMKLVQHRDKIRQSTRVVQRRLRRTRMHHKYRIAGNCPCMEWAKNFYANVFPSENFVTLKFFHT